MWTKALQEYNQTESNGAASLSVAAGSGVWTNQYIDKSQLSG
jgi:hypothetical protein